MIEGTEITTSFGLKKPVSERLKTIGAIEQDLIKRALAQNLNRETITVLEAKTAQGGRVYLEIGHVDTRKEHHPDDTVVINITGGYGRGPECEGEVESWARAMIRKGLEMLNISLPGHGHSRRTKKVGSEIAEEPYDFDQVTEVIAQYIRENIKEDNNPFPAENNRQRKVILNAWSMGGITALKLAAKHPKLVDGIVLMDTPVYPMNPLHLIRRFVSYGFNHKGVKPEEKDPKAFKGSGLGIFWTRIKRRNLPEGIPFKTVLSSLKSMCAQNLETDDTLAKVARTGIPILILNGQNDHVVPKEQILKMERCLRLNNGNVTRVEIAEAGHGLPAERPRAVGREIYQWTLKNNLSRDIEIADYNPTVNPPEVKNQITQYPPIVSLEVTKIPYPGGKTIELNEAKHELTLLAWQGYPAQIHDTAGTDSEDGLKIAKGRGRVYVHQENPFTTEMYFPIFGSFTCYTADPKHPESEREMEVRGSLTKEQAIRAKYTLIQDADQPGPILMVEIEGEVFFIKAVAEIPPGFDHATVAGDGECLFLAVKAEDIEQRTRAQKIK